MSNRNWPMTVKGNTGKGGVSYNDLLRQIERLKAENRQLHEQMTGLVDEIERMRFEIVELEGKAVTP